jgi:superfamily II DNA helicase RecQ
MNEGTHPPGNVRYTVVNSDESDETFYYLLQDHPTGAGIVFCDDLPKEVARILEYLRQFRPVVLPYHRLLGEEKRINIAHRFMTEKHTVIVACGAFPDYNEIDRIDVRFVAHIGLPWSSLNQYIQQVHLAGRDGAAAEAWISYNKDDISKRRNLIDHRWLSGSTCDEDKRALAHQNLNELVAYFEDAGCRRNYMLRHLGNPVEEPCGNCDNCTREVHLWDGSRHGTTDIEKHHEALKRIDGIRYSSMGGFGKISCCECSFAEKNTSFLHGSEGSGTSSTGYQCLSCGEFAALAPGDSLQCQCGGSLSRDHLLFCPKCKSHKLIYRMLFMT